MTTLILDFEVRVRETRKKSVHTCMYYYCLGGGWDIDGPESIFNFFVTQKKWNGSS